MARFQARDSLASNTIRVRTLDYVQTRGLNEDSCMPRYYVQSILSEVYSADKKISNGKKVDSSAIATLIRKGCTRRVRTPRFKISVLNSLPDAARLSRSVQSGFTS